MKRHTVGFIGAGKVGTALAIQLVKAGYPVVAVFDLDLNAAQELAVLVPGCSVCESAQEVANDSEHVFITTPDDFIRHVAAQLVWRPLQHVVHCSGAVSIDVLEAPERAGSLVGSFHPCQAFANADQAVQNLPGSTFAIEARGNLLHTLQDMASHMGCDSIVLKPGHKPLYHAAAVFVSNYVVTLVSLATGLFENFGISTAQATRVLMPLMQGNLNNIKNIGLPDCLTGPIARGDVSTIQKHIAAFQEHEPSLMRFYGELGLKTIPIALAKGAIDQKAGERLRELLKAAAESNKNSAH
jgi:predicted short-subunit dehydrogenase-like oxidoreductase (DUF2520 family)